MPTSRKPCHTPEHYLVEPLTTGRSSFRLIPARGIWERSLRLVPFDSGTGKPSYHFRPGDLSCGLVGDGRCGRAQKERFRLRCVLPNRSPVWKLSRQSHQEGRKLADRSDGSATPRATSVEPGVWPSMKKGSPLAIARRDRPVSFASEYPPNRSDHPRINAETRSNSSWVEKSMMIWPRSLPFTLIETGVPKRW